MFIYLVMQDQVEKITSESHKICKKGMNKNATLQHFLTHALQLLQLRVHVKNI